MNIGAATAGSSVTGAIFAAGSWYLAEKIRSEALSVEPGPAMPCYDDVHIVGLPAGQVQLLAIGDQPALFKPQLYGVAWQGGIGCLGTSLAVSGDVVTRPLTVMSGSVPEVGQLAALERAYFLGSVEAALRLPVEEIAIQGPLGPLPAWYFPGRGESFVIGVHGQNGARKDVLRVVDT